jgi:hypothetical protein
MSRRAWFIFFLTMLLASVGYVGWWVRCALVPARPVCLTLEEYAFSGSIDFKIISGKFTKDAFEHYKYYLIDGKIPHVNIDEKIYIPLWVFLEDPGGLRAATRFATFDIADARGVHYERGFEMDCDEIIKSGGIEPGNSKYKDYPPKWLRNFMLGLALFNPRQERLKSCDWLCGESRKWQVRQFTLTEERKHTRIWLDWDKETRAYYDGQQKDNPGLFLDYLRARLGGRNPY